MTKVTILLDTPCTSRKSSFDKIDYSILLGNALDHFDNNLYVFLSPLLAPLFFPHEDPIVQLIMIYSVLGTSLVTRPLGAFMFGNIAKNYGAIHGLSFSLIGVCICTLFFGMLPTYEQLGHFAPIALIGLRFVKGIFSAGECAISKLYIIDGKENNNAFRASYIYPISSMVGMVAVFGVSAYIYGAKTPELWRMCFIGVSIMGGIGYVLRIWGKVESPKIDMFKKFEWASFQLLVRYRLEVLQVALTTGLSHITSVIPFVILNTLMPIVDSTITMHDMMKFNTGLLIFDLILIPIAGRLLERYSMMKIMTYSLVVLGVTAPLLMALLADGGLVYSTFVRLWIVVLGVIFLCPQHLYYQRLFDDENRDKYFVVGMANAIGAATIGKLTPALCMWFWHLTHNMVIIGFYVTVVAAANLILFYFQYRKR
jgi:MFS family permease